MALQLFGHPFSSYTWKALIALYETDTPFEFRDISGDKYPENEAALAAAWPPKQFPVLVDGDLVLPEASIIVEHVAPGFIPAAAAGRETRLLDRIFDNHVMSPAQAVVAEHLPFITPTPDAGRIVRAKAALDIIYRWLNERLAGRCWAAGEDFTLADCAGAPALFYADWVSEIPGDLTVLRAYRARALSRPSVARCVEDARPYRRLFPLGAPDRD